MDRVKSKMPDKPGVYFFKGKSEILYIGKATSLRDRVRSYFGKDLLETRGPKLVEMLDRATSVSFEVTGSVLEALILESKLIKKYQPPYNAREKDDRSYNFVVITKENFPRVIVIRERDLLGVPDATWRPGRQVSGDIKYQFGPFPHGGELREAMKIVRKLFPYRDKCQPHDYIRHRMSDITGSKPCFNAQLGLCPGVCSGGISKGEYAKTIRNIKLFLDGKHSNIFRNVRMTMKKAIKKQDFEKAIKLRDQIFALQHINDVALLKTQNSKLKSKNFKIEAYDIAHISGMNTVGTMVVMEGGELAKNEYKRFRIKGVNKNKSNDTANLEELLRRRLNHQEWSMPDLIVIDGGNAQRNTALRVISKIQFPNNKPAIVSVVKDDKHKARDIIGDSGVVKDYKNDILLINQESHRFTITYHKRLRDRL